MDERRPPDKASAWLVALAETPDDAALQAQFAAWMAADPAHARDWDEISHTYDMLAGIAPARRDRAAADAVQSVRRIRRETAAAPRRRLLAFASAALAASLALALLPSTGAFSGADHVSGTAELRAVELEDGSTVRLAPRSSIAVAYSAAERRIRLLNGTAFFEVRPQAGRPFRVEAAHMEATAIGTSFEVRRDGGARRVAVRSGTVQVEDEGPPPVSVRLAAGDWVQRAGEGEVLRGREVADEVAAWLDGVLIAKDRPVQDVVAEIRRYHPGFVILLGESLGRQPLTGVYSLANPAAALRAIAEAQGATVYQVSPWVLVIAGS